MKKQSKSYIIALFLLGIYAISILPSLVWHHHDHEIVAYEVADLCEKSIYYSDSDEKCHHQAHLSTAIEKCNLCDHHTLVIDIFNFPIHNFFQTFYGIEFVPSFEDYHDQIVSIVSNRGPPIV